MFSEDLKGMIPTVLDCPRFKYIFKFFVEPYT